MKILPLQCEGAVDFRHTFVDLSEKSTPMPIDQVTIYPNPFNPMTNISFFIDNAQKIELFVYDMAGKRIAILADRLFKAGAHSLDWYGKDLRGCEVASGTYLMRMVSDKKVISKKMMLIR